MKLSKWAGRPIPIDSEKLNYLVDVILDEATYNKKTGFLLKFGKGPYVIDMTDAAGKPVVITIHMISRDTDVDGLFYPNLNVIEVFYDDFSRLASYAGVDNVSSLARQQEWARSARSAMLREILSHELTHALDPGINKNIKYRPDFVHIPISDHETETMDESYKIILGVFEIIGDDVDRLSHEDYRKFFYAVRNQENFFRFLDQELDLLGITRTQLLRLSPDSAELNSLFKAMSLSPNAEDLHKSFSNYITHVYEKLPISDRYPSRLNQLGFDNEADYLADPAEFKAFFGAMVDELKTTLLSDFPKPLLKTLESLPTLARYTDINKLSDGAFKKIIKRIYSSLYQWMVENGYDPKTGKKVK